MDFSKSVIGFQVLLLFLYAGFVEYSNDANISTSIADTGNIESEFLNGEIVKFGRMLGTKTPYNEVLWHHAEQMADNMMQPGYYKIDQLHKEVELLSRKK